MERKFLLTILVIFNTVIAVKSNNVPKNYCNRQKEQCNGEKNFECGLDYCSIDEVSCKSLLYLKALIRSIFNLKTYEKQIQSFHSFLMKIEDCEPAFLKKDICIRGKSCHKMHFFSLKFSGMMIPTRVECPCDKDHPYACTNRLCASHLNICKALRQNLYSEKFSASPDHCEKNHSYF